LGFESLNYDSMHHYEKAFGLPDIITPRDGVEISAHVDGDAYVAYAAVHPPHEARLDLGRITVERRKVESGTNSEQFVALGI
jgi:hypothetical protein